MGDRRPHLVGEFNGLVVEVNTVWNGSMTEIDIPTGNTVILDSQ